MAWMPQVVLLAGVLLALYGVAVLGGGAVAASRPTREHSHTYGMVACGVGGALVVVGAVWLAAA